MSAYIVSTDTIDFLVTASRLWRLAGDGYLPYDARNLTDNELGQVLLSENARSVNARYSETNDAPVYEYRSVRFDAISAIDVLKSAQCLSYHPARRTTGIRRRRIRCSRPSKLARSRTCADTAMRRGAGRATA